MQTITWPGSNEVADLAPVHLKKRLHRWATVLLGATNFYDRASEGHRNRLRHVILTRGAALIFQSPDLFRIEAGEL